MAANPGRKPLNGPISLDLLNPNRNDEVCELLRSSASEACDLIPRGSNYTFLVKLSLDHQSTGYGVYKPMKGETPLWDFPMGTLYKREHAAYLLSEVLGWCFVPPTVIWDGPHGVGSLQIFVNSEQGITFFELRETHPFEIKRIAVFDCICNNTDRKGGDCIKDPNGTIWAIDHGLTFHSEYKLRTVIWDYGGEPVPKELLQDVDRELQRFHSRRGLAQAMKGILSEEEIESLAYRMSYVLEHPVLPELRSRRDVPWPLV